MTDDYSEIVKRYYELRRQAKTENDPVKLAAIKLEMNSHWNLINSSYGKLGRITFRHHGVT